MVAERHWPMRLLYGTAASVVIFITWGSRHGGAWRTAAEWMGGAWAAACVAMLIWVSVAEFLEERRRA